MTGWHLSTKLDITLCSSSSMLPSIPHSSVAYADADSLELLPDNLCKSALGWTGFEGI